ncbi:MAG: hypothetical protein GX442_08320 [Candidatus Riflebacteria bacterium]|nr:hypothetical protein [Candidatus Riflebacteria bacterium]
MIRSLLLLALVSVVACGAVFWYGLGRPALVPQPAPAPGSPTLTASASSPDAASASGTSAAVFPPPAAGTTAQPVPVGQTAGGGRRPSGLSPFLKAIRGDLERWPLHRSPDVWLLRAWARRQAWPKVAATLRGALGRPQPHHFRHLFSTLSAWVELRSWMTQAPSSLNGQVIRRLEAQELVVPGSWSARLLAPGAGWLPAGHRAAPPAGAGEPAPPGPASAALLATLTTELSRVLADPSSLPAWVDRREAAGRDRCRILLALANARLARPDPTETFAAVDFVYQNLRPVSPTGPAPRPTDDDDWTAQVDRDWGIPFLPVCSGERLLLSRGRWICPRHDHGAGGAVASGPDPLAEAWEEFLFCHPERRPDPYRSEGQP